MVPGPQVWHRIQFRSQGAEVRSSTGTAACWCCSTANVSETKHYVFAPGLMKPGTTRWRDVIRQEREEGSTYGLMANWLPHNISVKTKFCQCTLWVLGDYRTYGNLFLTSGLGYGSRKSIRDRNSPQVWKHLKHITRLTAFKDIFLTSKHPQPLLPVSHTLSTFASSWIKIRKALSIWHRKPLLTKHSLHQQ